MNFPAWLPNRKIALWGVVVACSISTIVELLVETEEWFAGWLVVSFFIYISLLGLYILYQKAGAGKALAWIIAVAFLVRLFVGVALMYSLPRYGYDTEQQKAGYVFFDAYRRDAQAHELADSDQPMMKIFTRKYSTDQYGGYLAISMFVYRYLSPEAHRPQLMVILSAFFGALTIPFMWLLARRLLGASAGIMAGWIAALYPQGVLLGASQMREPIIILCITIAFWALVEWIKTGDRKCWIYLGFAAVGLLFISPGILIPLIVFLVGWWWLDRRGRPLSPWVYLVIVGLLLLGLVVFSYGLAREGQFARNSPVEIILKWFKNAVEWDTIQSTQSSGRLEFMFNFLPDFMRLPFLVGYGVFQPVLPAALLDKAAGIWRLISSLLAGGWYLLLPMLIYSTFTVFRMESKHDRGQYVWLVVCSWLWILISSARAGGDQWDNPRYRTMILPWLILMAILGWQWAKQHKFVWLKRLALMEGVFLLFFTQWYAARYYRIFRKLDFGLMLLLITISIATIILAGWWSDRRSSTPRRR